MVSVTGGSGKITIQFNQKVGGSTFDVTVTGGPTNVEPFSVTLNGNGTGTFTVPNNGTSSALQPGSYQVEVTQGTFDETFNTLVSP